MGETYFQQFMKYFSHILQTKYFIFYVKGKGKIKMFLLQMKIKA